MSDPSPSGLRQAAGMMVNYVYDEAEVVANHEAYVNEGLIAHSRAVASLVGPGRESGRRAGRVRALPSPPAARGTSP